MSAPISYTVETVAIESLVCTAGTQHRAALDGPTASKYGQQMAEGTNLGAIEVVRLTEPEAGMPAGTLILAGGFHRVQGAREVGIPTLKARVYPGTLDGARVMAFDENATHGLPQSRDDLQKKLLWALQHPKLGALSNRELARRAGATHPTVAAARERLAEMQARAAARNAPKPVDPRVGFDADGAAGGEPEIDVAEGQERPPDWLSDTMPPKRDASELPPLRKGDPIETALTYAMSCGPTVAAVFPVFGGEVELVATYKPTPKFNA